MLFVEKFVFCVTLGDPTEIKVNLFCGQFHFRHFQNGTDFSRQNLSLPRRDWKRSAEVISGFPFLRFALFFLLLIALYFEDALCEDFLQVRQGREKEPVLGLADAGRTSDDFQDVPFDGATNVGTERDFRILFRILKLCWKMFFRCLLSFISLYDWQTYDFQIFKPLEWLATNPWKVSTVCMYVATNV